jgi:uncharacterized phage protein (TIGR01671 family)
MSRVIKFRCWNPVGKCMHDWSELVEKNKIHLLAQNSNNYPVMQFTGMYDENGVEIYEGDIVEFCGVNCQIVWDRSDASFFAESSGGLVESGQEWDKNCVVVGNIYQNKEMLD